MARVVFLYNPASRLGARAHRRVQAMVRSSDSVATRFVPVAELAAMEDVPDRLVVVGGDGTINAAAQWLRARGASCPLAILPAGTGNNLARGLQVPLDLERAFPLAMEGTKVRTMDLVAYRGGGDDRERVMVQTSALGFPAEMAARYDRLRRRPLLRFLFAPLGTHIYKIIGLLGLAEQRRLEKRGKNILQSRWRLPGEEIEEKVFAIFLGNERSLGGNFIPCPRAQVDDGAIDICLVRAGTGAPYLKLFREVLRGRHLALTSTVVYRQTPGPVDLELSSPSSFLVDGDLWVRSDRFHFEVLPRRLDVVCG